MSKFELKGIEIQQSARTAQWAINAFSHSCDICCFTGKHINCDKCAIEQEHKNIMKERFGVIAQ